MDALRRRRAALHAGPRGQPGHRRPDRRGVGRGRAQLRHQAVERHALRAGRTGPRSTAELPVPALTGRRRPLDPRAAARGHRADRRAARGLPVRQGHRGALPLHVGRAVRLVRRAGQAAARRRPRPPTAPARCSGTSSTSLLRLLHPVVAVRHRDAVDRRSPAASRWSSRRGPRPPGARDGRCAPAGRVADLQKLVTEIRRFRTEQGVPDSRKVAARVAGSLAIGGGVFIMLRSLAPIKLNCSVLGIGVAVSVRQSSGA